jgi:hypothetical protein
VAEEAMANIRKRRKSAAPTSSDGIQVPAYA